MNLLYVFVVEILLESPNVVFAAHPTSPKCELQCEMPACPYGGTKDPWAIESPFPWWALVIGIFLFLIIVLSSLK